MAIQKVNHGYAWGTTFDDMLLTYFATCSPPAGDWCCIFQYSVQLKVEYLREDPSIIVASDLLRNLIMATVSSALKARLRHPSMLSKVARAEDVFTPFPSWGSCGLVWLYRRRLPKISTFAVLEDLP